MSYTSGLEMNGDGLSEEMKAFGKTTHSAFLQEHGISSWPTTMTVERKDFVLNRPQEYAIYIKCGVHGKTFSLDVTTNPEAGLRNHLRPLLDETYAMQEKMKPA